MDILTTLLLIVGFVSFPAAGWAAGEFVRGRRRPVEYSWIEAATRRRLLVHTRDDQTLDGLLERVDPDGLLLVSVRLLTADAQPLAGAVWVPRERIAWCQQPSEGSSRG